MLALLRLALATAYTPEVLNLATKKQLVGSLCKRHAVVPHRTPTACKRTVSGSISLPCSGCFPPFPHGTGSLSVFRECLALRDGPRRFGQDSTCPALLRWSLTHTSVTPTGLSPAMVALSNTFGFPGMCLSQLLQPRLVRKPTGLGSAPFARHYSGYRLFFLFLRVLRCFSSPGSPRAHARWQVFNLPGCPIQRCPDQFLFADPRTFSQLTTSFIASG